MRTQSKPRFNAPALCAIGLLLALAGCGGGGSDPATQSPPPSTGSSGSSPPVPPAKTVEGFECYEEAPVATLGAADVPLTDLAGVWAGTLVDCEDEWTQPIRAYVQSDGKTVILGTDPTRPDYLMQLLLRTEGDLFRGSGVVVLTNLWATGVWIDGWIEGGAAKRMRGRWSGDWANWGSLEIDQQLVGVAPLPLAAWPASWEGAGTAWTVTPDGAITGLGEDGCNYTGQLAAAVPAHFYALELVVSDCDLAGRYSGVAEIKSGPFNDLFIFGVYDDEDRALVRQLMSK